MGFRKSKHNLELFHFKFHLIFLLFLAFLFILTVSQLQKEKKFIIPTIFDWVGYGGYCTDWAYARWGEVHPGEELKVNGNAWEWYGYAATHGMPTGTTPQVGAVVVWDKYVGGAADVGHVAFVEQVYSESSFRVSEMNWDCGRWCKGDRDVTMSPGIHFIYSNQQQLSQCSEHDKCRGAGLNVYFIERGKKRLIPNIETLNYLNNRFPGEVRQVQDEQINKYPNGRGVPSITWDFNHDYVLVKNNSSNWTYVMSSGVKRYLFHYDQIDPGDGDFYYPSDVRILADSEFSSIPYGPALHWDGQLISNITTPEIYIIERNKKRLIPNYETFVTRAYKTEDVFRIPQEAISPIDTGRGVPSSTWHYTSDNVLIRGVSSDWTFVMKNSKKRYLFNYDQLDPDDGDYYYPSDLRVLTDLEINAISTGTPMTWAKQMVRGLGSLEVYLIERDKKRYLPNLETLLSRELSAENIVDIPQGIVDMFSTGREVPNVAWLDTHDNILLQENGSSKIWFMKNQQRNLLSSFDQVDIDGDWYYPSDVRSVTSLQDIPIQPLDMPLTLSMAKIYWASYSDYLERKLSIDYVVKNTGQNNAYSVTITGSINTQGVTNITAFPLLVGDIPAGGQKSITVHYTVPVGATRYKANIAANATDFNEYIHVYPAP